MTSTFTDTEIVVQIKAGGMKRQQAIAKIYQDRQLKNQIVAFVKKNNGNREDGIDVYHEGIIALDLNIRKDKYEQKGKLKAYLFSTCRFIWLNKLKKNQRMVYTSENFQLDQVAKHTPESLVMAEEQKDVIKKMLSGLGEKCQKILELWKLSYSMVEIADQVGLKNPDVARKQRYNCYQKLLQLVDKQPHFKSTLQ